MWEAAFQSSEDDDDCVVLVVANIRAEFCNQAQRPEVTGIVGQLCQAGLQRWQNQQPDLLLP